MGFQWDNRELKSLIFGIYFSKKKISCNNKSRNDIQELKPHLQQQFVHDDWFSWLQSLHMREDETGYRGYILLCAGV